MRRPRTTTTQLYFHARSATELADRFRHGLALTAPPGRDLSLPAPTATRLARQSRISSSVVPSFRELADVLPRLDPEVPVADLPTGISKPVIRASTFIEPTLTLIEGDMATAAIVLVAAPAAVGKSTFAEATATDRRALLWDIGEFAVGSGTFLGKLTESHGIAGLARVTGDLSAGRYGIVLDALDEGYSLARSDNFEAFVTDMAKQVAQLAPSGPAIIACGRTDTVELTNLLLSDTGVATCVLSLDFFSPDAARDFVDIQLDQAQHTAHRRFRPAFEQARDALFDRIAVAVGNEDDGGMDDSSFLGYAPVLIALARYLQIDNYQALAQDLAKGSPGLGERREGLWAFLRGIIDDLLQREQPKLVERLPANVRDAIPADRLEDLYSPHEQCARLLARVTQAAAPAVDLPAAVLPEYEKSVNETLGEHPFVGAGPEGFASVVFRDYVLGWALALGSDASSARWLARGRGFKPSPLLLRFFVEFRIDRATEAIDSEDLDILYASAQAEEIEDIRASLTITQTADGLDAEIITARGDYLEFIVTKSDALRLVLGGRLARADLSAPDWTVILGRAGTEAVIGPDVTIECNRLVVAAASLRIEARNEEEVVTWQANRVEHEAAEFKLGGANRQRLRLNVAEQPVYPWTGFVSTDAVPSNGHEPELEGALRELKKLSAWFKPGPVRARAPALPVKIMDVLVARGRVSPEMYEYAVETGLVTVEGKVCLLHPQQFGMNIVDLRARTVTPPIREYLAGYVRAQPS